MLYMGLKKADGAVTDTDEEAANELANWFQHMFTKDDGVDQGNRDNETPIGLPTVRYLTGQSGISAICPV